MKAQSQIQRILGTPEAMDTIAAILAGEQFASRRAVGRRVCAEFGFRDRFGRLQMATCLRALNVLVDRSERIVPPIPAVVVSGGGIPSLLAFGASLAESAPERLQRMEKLQVQRPRAHSQRQIWNTPIANEHRPGMTTVAGAAAEALSGAFGTRLAESWMNWSDEQGATGRFEPRLRGDLVGAHRGARLVAPLPAVDGLLGLAEEFAFQ